MSNAYRRIAFTSQLLETLGQSEFWGVLTVKFERGVIVHIQKQESIKPEGPSEKTRDHENPARHQTN